MIGRLCALFRFVPHAPLIGQPKQTIILLVEAAPTGKMKNNIVENDVHFALFLLLLLLFCALFSFFFFYCCGGFSSSYSVAFAISEQPPQKKRRYYGTSTMTWGVFLYLAS